MSGRPSIRRLAAAAVSLAAGGCVVAALASPGSAPAASNHVRAGSAATARSAAAPTIHLSQPCYTTSEKGALHGTGFDANARWKAQLSGSPFGSGTTTANGTIAATFGAPSHLRPGSSGEDSYQLVVHEGSHAAGATFLVTHLFAHFSPESGNLATLKVRFRLLGWGRSGSLYLHYVSPKGAVRLSRYLGPAGGACGHLTTSPIKLFPFTPKVGLWRLQISKSAAYKATSRPNIVFPYRVS